MKNPKTETHVKEMVKDWYKVRAAYHYAPIQNGLGVHGIPDRLGCLPIVVTQAMVGKRIGLFAGVEAKRPGRRGEKNRGMSVHQLENGLAIVEAGGLFSCCDGQEDLDELDARIEELLNFVPVH